jgi:hypothetical protein
MQKKNYRLEYRRSFFNEDCEDEFLFVRGPTGEPKSVVCEILSSDNEWFDCNRHCVQQYKNELKEN